MPLPLTRSPSLCMNVMLYYCKEVSLTQMLNSNSFFTIPVFHFPWSEKGREVRATKTERETV